MNEYEVKNWYDSYGYMTPEHPGAFLDHEKKKMPNEIYPKDKQVASWRLVQECLLCKGYGGWNLKLNQYMAYKPPMCHFQASCSNCNGWGWTPKEDHVHEWDSGINVSRCLTKYTCTICKKVRTIDSSD